VTLPVHVEISLSINDADTIHVDSQARLLRQDMTAQGFDAASVAAPDLPGTRGNAELIGVIQLLLIPALGPKLLDVLQVWLANRKQSTIKMKVSSGTHVVELEYDPAKTTWHDIDSLLSTTRSHFADP